MLIIATVGLNSTAEDKIRKMILAGADILRFNFAHRIIADNVEYVKTAKAAIENINSHTKIMIDLPTNKVRLGNFNSIFYSVREGQEVIFKSATYSPDCNEFIPIETEKIGTKLNLNQTITIGDGEVAFQITNITDDDTIVAEAFNNGTIKTMRTFNAGLHFTDNDYIQYCKDILKKVLTIEPDFLVIPYINQKLNERMITDLELEKLGYKIVAKIESNINKDEMESIYQHPLFQSVLIDLGEIGVNIPFYRVGNYYQQIKNTACKHQKPTWIMTHLLESTINNYIPNRAEIINLTDVVRDGIKGIVLGHETALGARPAYSIHVAKQIIEEAQKTEIC
ncbi:MAG: hypothetical protein HY980_04040 [Candidatus Magasanikbacteria bacterium]|nr:hypothetical protein [Candidatus Magasanikbacteria bacterium]